MKRKAPFHLVTLSLVTFYNENIIVNVFYIQTFFLFSGKQLFVQFVIVFLFSNSLSTLATKVAENGDKL